MADKGLDQKPNMQEQALYWASRGMAIVPCHRPVFGKEGECTGCTCKQTGCKHPGKHPRQATLTRVLGQPEPKRGGYHQATSDPRLVMKLWDDMPNANIGIAVGKTSGIIVVDMDPRHGGEESIRKMRADGIVFSKTATNSTGGGGVHVIYRYPEVDVELPNKVEDPRYPGVEILTGPPSGIIAPPSLHPSGRRYARKPDHDVEKVGITECPASLVQFILQHVTGAAAEDGSSAITPPEREFGVSSGARAPQEKLDALLQADDLFRRTWAVKRPEFMGDLSRYDQALADAAATAGWEAQEIVDLLIEFRERQGENPKPVSYYRSTVEKALASRRPSQKAKRTQATELIEIAMTETSEFFQDPNGVDYARFRSEIGDGQGKTIEVYEVQPIVVDGPYRDALDWRYRDVHGTEASPGEMNKAIRQLRRHSKRYGPRNLQPRATKLGPDIWIDRGDIGQTAYRVGQGAVELVKDPPALWWRPANTGEIPEFPSEAVTYDLWRVAELVNIPRDGSNAGIDLLYLVYLVLGFYPASDMPHPMLLVTGPEGSAKSSMCDIVKWTVDPPKGRFGLDGRVRLRKDNDAQIVLYNNAVVHFDNVSRIEQSMADDLSTAVTGVEVAARKLFSDYTQVSLKIRRTIMLTSINHPIRANDLISRTLWFPLPMVDPHGTAHRDGQAKIDEYWRDRPLIVGACLNTLARAMAMPTALMPFTNRFPDWCQLGANVAQVLGRSADEFAESLRRNMVNHRLQALEGQFFAKAVYEMMLGESAWSGQMHALLTAASEAARRMGFPTDRREHWPQHPSTAGDFLERSAATLAQLGISYRRSTVKGNRLIHLARRDDVPATGGENEDDAEQDEAGEKSETPLVY